MSESSEDDVAKLMKLQSKQEDTEIHNDDKSIIVTNLDPKTTKTDILTHFKACGKIKDIFIKSHYNRSMPTKAYVEFDDLNSVEIALALNKTILKGKIISVSKKRIKKINCNIQNLEILNKCKKNIKVFVLLCNSYYIYKCI